MLNIQYTFSGSGIDLTCSNMASGKLATGEYFQLANILLPFLRLLYRYEAAGNFAIVKKERLFHSFPLRLHQTLLYTQQREVKIFTQLIEIYCFPKNINRACIITKHRFISSFDVEKKIYFKFVEFLFLLFLQERKNFFFSL